MKSETNDTAFEIDGLIAQSGLDTDAADYIESLDAVSADDVKRELGKRPGVYSFKRLLTLISPAAEAFIEQMAQQARLLTLQRFGKTMQLYVPMYVSNFCINQCEYCGYNTSHSFKRTRLTVDESIAEAEAIAKMGFKHILMLCGEDPKFIDADYFVSLARKLREKFCAMDVEIYPMTQAEYEQLFNAGIDGITIYQETYNRKLYKKLHPGGPKANFSYRLETLDRAASAGFRRLGLGVLLGLADWRVETLALGLHADYLMKKYWRSQVSFSFPRMRPAQDVEEPMYDNIISDKNLVQMMLALRLCFADSGIVISTRESAEMRKNLINLCVTKMSAGSKTNPGGYTGKDGSVSQFEVDDTTSPQEVEKLIKEAGFEAVWKDWDSAFIPD